MSAPAHSILRRTVLVALATLAACADPAMDGVESVAPELDSIPGFDVTRSGPGAGAAAGWMATPTQDEADDQRPNLLVLLDEAALTRHAIGTAPAARLASARRLGDLTDDGRDAALGWARQQLEGQLGEAGVVIVNGYRNFPMLAVRAPTGEARAALAAHPLVTAIEDNRALRATDAESFALIQQPEVEAAGGTGAGTSVAVIDSGLDYTRAAFGSCTAPGVPASCRVVAAVEVAVDDALLDDYTLHGTNVAGIVAGVAPGAGLIGLDVFTSGGYAYVSGILTALDWVVSNRATYDIAAVNLSLGGGLYTTQCDSIDSGIAGAFATVRDHGIVVVAAAGNNGATNALSWPACLSSVASVGAVYKTAYAGFGWGVCTDANVEADRVTCFSNSAAFLTLLAPGALISAADTTKAGTSQAAPHVAGAAAVLRAAFPSASAEEIVARMVAGGTIVVDPRNQIATPRLDLAASMCQLALGSVPPFPIEGGSVSVELTAECAWEATSSAPWLTVVIAGTDVAAGDGDVTLTLAAEPNTTSSAARSATLSVAAAGSVVALAVSQDADSDAPTGSVTINEGAPWTTTRDIELQITASDALPVTAMCVTTGASCTAFEPFAASRALTLPTGEGTQTVKVWLRDQAGNTTTAESSPRDSIGVDTAPPTNGTVAFSSSGAPRSVVWSGFSDATSGLAGYKVVATPGLVPPATCSVGTLIYEGIETSHPDLSSVGGELYSYRVCAVDVAGNVSSGRALVGAPLSESDPPTGTVVINDGLAFTSLRQVTLSITASDESGVTHMCVTTGATCSSWSTFATTRQLRVSSGDGLKTASVWLRDSWGNVTPTPLTASITLDTTRPLNGAIVASHGNASNTLSMSGFSDANGVASYVVVYAASATAPSSCRTGTLAYEGEGSAFTHDGLVNGTTYAYRVCARDGAGNLSTGAVASARPRPESDPPDGALSINGGAGATRARSVTVTLAASDASAITGSCVSERTTCTSWRAWSDAPQAVTLSSGSGVKTLRAWLRDEWGNTTAAPVTASIVLDTVAPTNGIVTATPGAAANTLSWSSFVDTLSGITEYRVVFSIGSTAPTTCAAGTLAYAGPDMSFTHAELQSGTMYAYRVCAVDAAGNRSSGVVVRSGAG